MRQIIYDHNLSGVMSWRENAETGIKQAMDAFLMISYWNNQGKILQGKRTWS
jgi:hypothetical protein